MMRANLELRTASRVLVRVARFPATAFFELEKRAKKIEWGRYLGAGSAADFRVTARKSKLYHSDAIAQRLGAAAEATPARSRGGRGTGDPATQLFVVRVVRDEFTISADTSGDLLHLRGYRQAVGKAPLRETLAAALLLAAGWTGDTPLVDPLCGSGTIPIEGALIARKLAPGLHREFAFSRWPEFDGAAWKSLRLAAQAAALASSPVPIMGSDRDAGAIEASAANAERAGVKSDVSLSVRALSAASPPGGAGLLATNPPYGVRVSETDQVRNLYARLGQLLRATFAGWDAAIYSPDRRLTSQVGLEPEELFRTTNGGIKVAAVRFRARSGVGS